MLDVVGETFDGLVLKASPKADTLEASLDAYTKPNLIQLAETNDFDVKKSWNKAQMTEVISEGLRNSLEERLSAFDGKQLVVLQEVADGNTKQAEANSEVVASAVSKGLLYVSSDGDELSFTMPAEFEEKLGEGMADDEPVETEEEPAAEAVNKPARTSRSARTVPFGFRRQRRKPVVKQRIVGKKIGRNEPCPRGSGKKYKKCCLKKDKVR